MCFHRCTDAGDLTLQVAERDGTRVMWTAESSKRRRRPSSGKERWTRVSRTPVDTVCTSCMASVTEEGRYDCSSRIVLCNAVSNLCNTASIAAFITACSDAARCDHDPQAVTRLHMRQRCVLTLVLMLHA
jgi:hypothetical protein